MLRLVAFYFVAFAVIFLASVLILAPQIPSLIREGFPKPLWPAPGRFAEIAGAVKGDTDRSPAAPIAPPLRKLFEESEGRALLVLHRGVLVNEHYGDGFTRESRLNSFSMAKGLVSALMLKAVSEGRVASLDVPIGDLLPGLDPSLAVATIRDLLEMRSGVIFGDKENEGTSNPFSTLARLHALGLDDVKAGLMGSNGRSTFLYRNINTALLGAALERVYGTSLATLLSERIWRPAGADTAYWRRYSRGKGVSPYCCLFATPLDWAKVGLFLMQNGTQEAPFLPDALHRAFLGRDLDAAAVQQGAYGLHVRHDVLDRAGEPLQGRFTNLRGMGGQVLYLMPEKDLVVVRFGKRWQSLHSTLYEAWRAILALDETQNPEIAP